MSLSGIEILRQEGGLSRPPLSKDGVSGLVIYGSSLAVETKYLTAIDGLDDFASDSIEQYHIKQYFDYSQSPLYVKTVTSAPTDFQEVEDLKNFAEGEPRQYAVLNLSSDYTSTQIQTLQVKMDELEDEFAPAIAIYSASLGSDTVEDLTTLRSLASKSVSLVISEDTTSEVATLRTTHGFVSTIGATLGNISKANVQENIGWVKKFNLVNIENYLQPAFIDGSLVSAKSLTVLNSLDDYGYVFMRKFVGSNGTYHNYSHSAEALTSDFNTIENNRVYNKCFRVLREAYLPEVNSPILVNSQGQLEVSTVKFLQGIGRNALQLLDDANEISAYSVDIDSKQNILSNNKLEVVAKIVPIGTSKIIEIKLGYSLTV